MTAIFSFFSVVDTESESLMPAVEQEELFDAEALPAGLELLSIDADERRGRFTAERVCRNRERYEAIVTGLAEGLGVRQLCRAFRVSPHTVQTIRERESSRIATEKQEFSLRLGRVARLALERIEEEIEGGDMSGKDLSVCLGIVLDKKALLDGEPTARVEHASPRRAEDLRALLAAEIEAARATLAAGAIELTAVSTDKTSAVSSSIPEQNGHLTVNGGTVVGDGRVL